jgi:predicted amidohydrolase
VLSPGRRYRPDPRKLIVHQGGRWRVAILICKDLLVDNVANTVARLGVNLLLVPAMSPATEGDRLGRRPNACRLRPRPQYRRRANRAEREAAI